MLLNYNVLLMDQACVTHFILLYHITIKRSQVRSHHNGFQKNCKVLNISRMGSGLEWAFIRILCLRICTAKLPIINGTCMKRTWKWQTWTEKKHSAKRWIVLCSCITFIGYLLILTAAQSIYQWIMNVQGCGRKLLWSNFRW